jgi:hypothetical protein
MYYLMISDNSIFKSRINYFYIMAKYKARTFGVFVNEWEDNSL